MLMVKLIILCVFDKMNSREQLGKITNKKKDSNMDQEKQFMIKISQTLTSIV